MGVSNLQGTPWYLERVHRVEGDELDIKGIVSTIVIRITSVRRETENVLGVGSARNMKPRLMRSSKQNKLNCVNHPRV